MRSGNFARVSAESTAFPCLENPEGAHAPPRLAKVPLRPARLCAKANRPSTRLIPQKTRFKNHLGKTTQADTLQINRIFYKLPFLLPPPWRSPRLGVQTSSLPLLLSLLTLHFFLLL